MGVTQGKDYKAEDWKPPEGLDISSMVLNEGKPVAPPQQINAVDGGQGIVDGIETVDETENGSEHGGDSFRLKKMNLTSNTVKIIVAIVVILVIAVLISMVRSKKNTDGKNSPTPMPQESTYQPPVELNVFHYSIEELAELRNNGFTAEEVEFYESIEIPAASLILDAQQKRQELYENEIAPYMDAASEEYKELAADSWVGQQEFSVNSDISGYRYYSEVWNVDYKKLPARGSQLFIKLISPEGETFFMPVTPEQYLNLKDAGNIVVDVKYTQLDADTRVITEVREKKISN